MDNFVFSAPRESDLQSYLKIGDIAGESLQTDMFWGTNGTAITAESTDLDAMHIDPVIPGFEDPLFG